MGERLNRALKMPLPQIVETLSIWRRMGGSKLTILGGEPTLHPDYCGAIRAAKQIGYEHVITTTNAQLPALRKLRQLEPDDFAYVQVSLDGETAASHDTIRGAGTFNKILETTAAIRTTRLRHSHYMHRQPSQPERRVTTPQYSRRAGSLTGKIPCLLDYRYRTRES